jgi:uncharacterized protein (DUF1800 family)
MNFYTNYFQVNFVEASCHFCCVILLCCFSSSSNAAMGDAEASHLLSRAGFALSFHELPAWAALSRQQAVEKLLQNSSGNTSPPPSWVHAPIDRPNKLEKMFGNRQAQKAFQKLQREHHNELSAWWLNEMLTTHSPLNERMTLFWHNHFVSGQKKVKVTKLLYIQNQLFRNQALGNFGSLLHAVSKDPAMLIYLDSASNRKDSPNENFAREVMELFTLGVGNYTEKDIKEAARAFTGWSVDRDTGEFMFRKKLHDDGQKTILGKTGNFDGDDVLDILLAQPQTAEFIVTKMWRELVNTEVSASDKATITKIAADFRQSRYDNKTALKGILLSDAFYAPENRGAIIKSPVDLIVGSLKQLDIKVSSTESLVPVLRQLGQNLFDPPNVKGWPGGEVWINTNSLLARKTFLDRLLRTEDMQANSAGMLQTDMLLGKKAQMKQYPRSMGIRFYAQDWFAQFKTSQQAQSLLLLQAPVAANTETPNTLSWLRALMLDPAFQLK